MKKSKEDNFIDAEEECYVASECICDDNGVHYVCSKCGKMHDDDLDALLCCLKD